MAALTLIGEQHDKVFSIVFGEGMINDAVSIILFRSVTHIGTSSKFDAEMALMVVGNFAYILLTSVAVGLFFGKSLGYLSGCVLSHLQIMSVSH